LIYFTCTHSLRLWRYTVGYKYSAPPEQVLYFVSVNFSLCLCVSVVNFKRLLNKIEISMILYLEEKLKRRHAFGNLRRLQVPGNLIDFASNDYLGLARSQKLRDAFLYEWEKHSELLNGLGSTGSRLLTGNSLYAQNLEEQIAAFHGYPAGIIFNCGYMANVGLLSTIADQRSAIIYDAGVHASTRDGIRLSKAQAFPFRHNDLNHLASRLKICLTNRCRFICVESIYSTDGSKAPLEEICLFAQKYDAKLIVDEAHAIGICGPNGQGLVVEKNLIRHVFAQVSTFGKALGVQGAIVLGGKILKKALHNFATSFIYTTALPFQNLAAIKCAYDLFPVMNEERAHLRKMVSLFTESLPNGSSTHIQSIIVAGNKSVKKAAKDLALRGYDVKPLMSPTVQRGNEVLRICLHAFNTEAQVSDLIQHCKALR